MKKYLYAFFCVPLNYINEQIRMNIDHIYMAFHLIFRKLSTEFTRHTMVHFRINLYGSAYVLSTRIFQ